jgi:hypothetical protein
MNSYDQFIQTQTTVRAKCQDIYYTNCVNENALLRAMPDHHTKTHNKHFHTRHISNTVDPPHVWYTDYYHLSVVNSTDFDIDAIRRYYTKITLTAISP